MSVPASKIEADRPSSSPRRPRIQVSLTMMMLLMVIFSVIAAGLLYASRVPAVQQELSVLTDGRLEAQGDPNRSAHLVFILFTLMAPVLTAGVLATGVNLLKMFRSR